MKFVDDDDDDDDDTQINTNESTHSEMGPVRQNPTVIQNSTHLLQQWLSPSAVWYSLCLPTEGWLG